MPFTLIDESIIYKELREHIPAKFLHHLIEAEQNELFNSSLISETEIREWMYWVERHDNLKVITKSIPDGILPVGCSGVLHDVRVHCAKFGPDDLIYDQHEDIRRKVARGNCVMELVYPNGKRTLTVLCRGLRKFTGDLYDDDDREMGESGRWQRYFLRPIETTARGINCRKYDGESGHFSAVWITDRFVICGGSKNVHLVFSKESDIDKYLDHRYNVCKNISKTLFRHLQAMSSKDADTLLSFLHHAKLTANLEFLNPGDQRVEDLSYLSKPDVRFFAWTYNELGMDRDHTPVLIKDSYCAVPIDFGVEIARLLKLNVCHYDYFEPSNLHQKLMEISDDSHRCEGEVLYFVDSSDCIIGMLKKKTLWYVMLNSIFLMGRFALTSKKASLDSRIQQQRLKIEKKIMDVQQTFNLSDEFANHWKSLTSAFFDWAARALDRGVVNHADIKTRFPQVWKMFLESEKRNDIFLNA